MAKEETMRLSQAARKLNVGTTTIIASLEQKGFQVDNKPNTKITVEQFNLLAAEFSTATIEKEEAAERTIGYSYRTTEPALQDKKTKQRDTTPAKPNHYEATTPHLPGVKSLGKVALSPTTPPPATEPTLPAEPTLPPTPIETTPAPPPPKEPLLKQKIVLAAPEELKGLTVLGKVVLPEPHTKRFKQVASSDIKPEKKQKSRKRIIAKEKPALPPQENTPEKEGVSAKEIQEQIKSTLEKLHKGEKGGVNRAKYRKEKRTAVAEVREGELLRTQKAAKTLQVTEYSTANDLASLMNVPINQLLSTCLALGMVTSINQRLDAEAITILADEFGYGVAFVDVTAETIGEETTDQPEDLIERAPIVTIMGHVDHGKTSLIDYIRNTQVAAKEAGGITQHMRSYDVITASGKRIVFLDTPGHEAFTTIRTRGTKVTDIVIIVIAADDSVMPQTKEAINQAQAAGVPMLMAINKIDKPQANPEKVKEDLAKHNILVEDWGGKYQCQAVSAKTGQGVSELLEKVLLEAELLGLKANPNKPAKGTVLEAFLDQGRGYSTTMMVQEGTLHIGDILLAGTHYGKIKALLDYQKQPIKKASPATFVQALGLGGAPKAGDMFRVMRSIQEAQKIASQRQQILRAQDLRAKTHLTLEELGKRLAIGNFQELKLILKGDVDGSVEALSDALLRLSTDEIKVTILSKGIGPIAESDILLAAASNALVLGFQVKPAAQVRKLAEKEHIEIRLYSIIYDAIQDITNVLQSMLTTAIEEVTTGFATVKKTFKITKIGTIAGCYVTEGYIHHTNPIRLIRAGHVIYTGPIIKLKHLTEEIERAKAGHECGISMKNFNDIKVEDVVEGFERKEIARTL